ncbi:MAG: hypothetical protein RL434_579 [Pseudomonadota bacterium]|jgi:hypothetical protein
MSHPPEAYWRRLLRAAANPELLRGSLKVALVVGSVLNAINQGAAILEASGVSWPHVILNFIVPFCVATYSAARNQIRKV